ncbi:MAG: EndoU domain-containing protein [Cellulosilyticaceae bacterium]
MGKGIGSWVYNKEIWGVSDFIGAATGVRDKNDESNVFTTLGAFTKGVVVDGVGGTIDSLVDVVIDPTDALEGIAYIGMHPKEALGSMYQGAKTYINDKIINGTPEERWEAIGQGIFEVASCFVGVGEAKAVASSAKVTTKLAKAADTIADTAKIVDKVSDAGKAAKVAKVTKVANIVDKITDSAKGSKVARQLIKNAQEGLVKKARTAGEVVDSMRNSLNQMIPRPQLAMEGIGALDDTSKTADRFENIVKNIVKPTKANNATSMSSGKPAAAHSGVNIKNSVEPEKIEKVVDDIEDTAKAVETSYVKSIADLKNTENFRDTALNHILEGEINRSGMAVGYHYEKFPTAKGKILQETKSLPNDFGVYTGKVEVAGVRKSAKSSFFPEEWSAQEVVDSINEAFSNKEFVQGTKNTFIGESNNGIQIKMYIDNDGNIISAFPVY